MGEKAIQRFVQSGDTSRYMEVNYMLRNMCTFTVYTCNSGRYHRGCTVYTVVHDEHFRESEVRIMNISLQAVKGTVLRDRFRKC